MWRKVVGRLAAAVLPRLTLQQRLFLRGLRGRLVCRFGGFGRLAQPIFGLGAGLGGRRGRALLSYRADAFRIADDDPRFITHPALWHTREMVRHLVGMGYVVDVVDCADRTFLPRRDYEVFIGHGGLNFDRIATRLGPDTLRIYFFTGCYWRVHNERERARLRSLYRRRGVRLPPDRLIPPGEEAALRMARAIIGVGGAFARRSYATFPNVYTIPGAVMPDPSAHCIRRDFHTARNHFLFFAGPGNVHKGLDLVLEAFARLPHLHLWVCTRIGRAFARAYRELLLERENVHLLEWVPLRSPLFYRVVSRCAWSVLPSCAEGVATSVVELMQYGLVPVVSEACGVEVDGCGVLLERCTVEEIAEVAERLSRSPARYWRALSVEARRRVLAEHSREVCSRRLGEVLRVVLSEDSTDASNRQAV